MRLSDRLRLHRQADLMRQAASQPKRSIVDQLGESAYLSVLAAKNDMGMARLRMGALLCVLEESGSWRGKTAASNFRNFMVEEGIEPKSAYQYMQVSRKFVIELKCEESQLKKLAMSSMRALVAASKIATPENVDLIIDAISTLPRPEAIEVFEEMAATQQSSASIESPAQLQPQSKPVNKLINGIDDLTMDQRSELFQRLRVPVRTQRRFGH